MKVRKHTSDLGKDMTISEVYDALQDKYGEIMMLDITHFILFSLADGLDDTCNAIIEETEARKAKVEDIKKKVEEKPALTLVKDEPKIVTPKIEV